MEAMRPMATAKLCNGQILCDDRGGYVTRSRPARSRTSAWSTQGPPVVAVWIDRWLILDNRTLIMVPDDQTRYRPLYVLDLQGVCACKSMPPHGMGRAPGRSRHLGESQKSEGASGQAGS